MFFYFGKNTKIIRSNNILCNETHIRILRFLYRLEKKL